MTGKRETVTVYRDDLEFILKELQEYLAEKDVFYRRRFSVSAAVTRLGGMLGHVSDPDKTPVRPPLPMSRKETMPGGIKVPPYHPTKKGSDHD